MKLTPIVTLDPDAPPVLCAECGGRIVGSCEFDPDHSREKGTGPQSVVHIGCAPVVEGRLNAARYRLANAAPALLAACVDMLPLLEHAERREADDDAGRNGHRVRQLRRRLKAARAAIRKATTEGA